MRNDFELEQHKMNAQQAKGGSPASNCASFHSVFSIQHSPHGSGSSPKFLWGVHPIHFSASKSYSSLNKCLFNSMKKTVGKLSSFTSAGS